MLQDSPGALNVTLYSNARMQPANNLGNEPGTMLGSLTAISSFPSSLGQVTFSGNNLRLAPETTYWLVMSAPTNGSYEWAYETGITGSGVGFYPSWGISNDSGTSWFTDNLQPMQMSVIGGPVSSIPEPPDTWLVLVGTLTLVCAGIRTVYSRSAQLSEMDR
jgi:hypothetical protein